jgi:hypothetical protein
MSYGDFGVSAYSLYINGIFKSNTTVRYSGGLIHCTINGIQYEIQLSNTIGGSRIESVAVTTNGARLYNVAYTFNASNRLIIARVDGVAERSVYIDYIYEGNSIIIKERDRDEREYRIELSTDDNLGNVCNVLDFSEHQLTSNYVINPDLYYLNIYGAPIAKLPQGCLISRTNNNKLERVGKYLYEY